jgi:hypothetical protein
MYILQITVDVGFGHISSFRFLSGEVHQISMSNLVWPSVFFLLVMLQWSEPKAKGERGGGDLRLHLGYFLLEVWSLWSWLGDKQNRLKINKEYMVVLNLLRGMNTITFFRLSSKMVGGRPIPPSLSASVLSGRWLKEKINIRAAMPKQRPLSSSSLGSDASSQVVWSPMALYLVVLRPLMRLWWKWTWWCLHFYF